MNGHHQFIISTWAVGSQSYEFIWNVSQLWFLNWLTKMVILHLKIDWSWILDYSVIKFAKGSNFKSKNCTETWNEPEILLIWSRNKLKWKTTEICEINLYFDSLSWKIFRIKSAIYFNYLDVSRLNCFVYFILECCTKLGSGNGFQW